MTDPDKNWRAHCDWLKAGWDAETAKVEELRKALAEEMSDEASRDAARYRHIRKLCDENVGCCPCCGYDGLDFYVGSELDWRTDESIAGSSKESESG